jgi:M6 family metalloprotease-like protein
MNYFTVSVLWDICGDDIGRRGVIAHELGHFLGLDDLYDTSYDGQGIGTHGLVSETKG